MQAIGIVTLLVGVSHFLKIDNVLVPLASVILGLVVGELLDLDALLRRLGDHLEERFSKGESPVSRAFVTSSLLFCVGPLTVIGSLQDGLNGDYSLLVLKSALDYIAALAFASVLGWGVMLSAGTVLVVQGSLTLGAGFLEAVMKEVRVANMLPALLFAPLLVATSPLGPLCLTRAPPIL